MSLITQCPACNTLFKVVPDQLRVSDGWVRCGQCDEVFDANLHLQTTLQEARQSTFGDSQFPTASAPRSRFFPPEPKPRPEPSQNVDAPSSKLGAEDESQEPEDYAVQHAFVSSRFGSSRFAQEDAPAPAARTPVQSKVETEEETEEETEAAVRAEYEALLRSVESEPSGNSGPKPATGNDPSPEEEDNGALGLKKPAASGDEWADAIGEPVWSFAQTTTTDTEVVERPWVRPVLWVCAVTLSLVLVLQLLVHERDRLVAKAPALQPVVAGLCNALGCQIAPLREIESVVIDSSSFVKVRTDVYRVHLTLKNNALYEVATPALELTLTNVHDQPIARRIILPREFGGAQSSLAAGAELLASVAVRAQWTNDSQPVSGYRLLVFYP